MLDLSTVGPGARATRILADYGARVVKISAPAKSGAQVQPLFYAYSAQRGCLHMQLDLKAPAGREVLLALARRADVLLESFRPGVMARLGIGADELRAQNPRLIYCATTGYGQSGPAANWAGHDLNYLAMGGYLHTGGRTESGAPVLPGASIADSAGGGMHAAIAVLAALMAREKTGAGRVLDVSVTEGVLNLMSLFIDEHLATGASPAPGHNVLTGRYACYALYRCADGKWLSVAAIEARFFRNLCAALALADWAPRQYQDAAQPQLRAALAAAFAAKPRDQWVAQLAPNNTCVAPVYSAEELAADAHLNSRGAFVDAVAPTDAPGAEKAPAKFRQVGYVLAGTKAPEQNTNSTDKLLAEAGLTLETITQLRATGVLG